MKTLEHIRERINETDRKMAVLFRHRMEEVKEVALYKQEHGLPVSDPERERAVLEKNGASYPDDSTRDLYLSFLQSVMDISKEYQRQLGQ